MSNREQLIGEFFALKFSELCNSIGKLCSEGTDLKPPAAFSKELYGCQEG